jgi:hypothetical protein
MRRGRLLEYLPHPLVAGPLLALITIAFVLVVRWAWPLNDVERRLVGTWKTDSTGITFRSDHRYEIKPYLFTDVNNPVVAHEGWWSCSGTYISLTLIGDRAKWSGPDVFDSGGEPVRLTFDSEDAMWIGLLWLERRAESEPPE